MLFQVDVWFILLVLIVIGGVGYVIFHFIRKHW